MTIFRYGLLSVWALSLSAITLIIPHGGFGIVPDLTLVLVVLVALRNEPRYAPGIFWCGGFIKDILMGGEIIGVLTLLFFICGIALSYRKGGVIWEGFIPTLALCAVCSFFIHAIYFLIFRLASLGLSSLSEWTVVLFISLLSVLWAMPFYIFSDLIPSYILPLEKTRKT